MQIGRENRKTEKKKKTKTERKTTHATKTMNEKYCQVETKSQQNPHLNAHKIRINMINKVFNSLTLITFQRCEIMKVEVPTQQMHGRFVWRKINATNHKHTHTHTQRKRAN